MTGAVLQTVALDVQWPTIDPFLFCVHHLDHYPNGNAAMGPDASLAGREMGSDFAGIDGWRMYHGLAVPGFPQHPHRGFETVTFVRQGLIDHSDSLGARARFGSGDVQWLTAGSGIVHSEMFPLLDPDGPNTAELFQIWLNLPASDKMVEPYFTMLWNEDLPRVVATDGEGRTTTVTVITGTVGDARPPDPPPNSWASRPEADVAIWHLDLEPEAAWTLPAASGADTVRTLYLFGGSLDLDGTELASASGSVLRCDAGVPIAAGADGAEVLVLQGRPIGEPVARYGPFVMNTQAEIEQAFADYRATEFGGWPWSVDGPVHGRRERRFAEHPGGRLEQPV